MKRVYKYPLPDPSGSVQMEMPYGARYLDVQMQRGRPVLWALIDPDAPVMKQTFLWAGTGHTIEQADMLTYIATVQWDGGLVWHFFHLGLS